MTEWRRYPFSALLVTKVIDDITTAFDYCRILMESNKMIWNVSAHTFEMSAQLFSLATNKRIQSDSGIHIPQRHVEFSPMSKMPNLPMPQSQRHMLRTEAEAQSPLSSSNMSAQIKRKLMVQRGDISCDPRNLPHRDQVTEATAMPRLPSSQTLPPALPRSIPPRSVLLVRCA